MKTHTVTAERKRVVEWTGILERRAEGLGGGGPGASRGPVWVEDRTTGQAAKQGSRPEKISKAGACWQGASTVDMTIPQGPTS